MQIIHSLSPEVANTIAAGEVVERPVSIVKELVENSLDAHATYIQIYIEDGGKKLIRIVDNGVGISKEDLTKVAKRHHTSKINSVDDLLSISSHGFRGEALASIAAVSDFEIRSRLHDSEHGWQVKIKSDTREIKPIGIPEGTEVIVANLFKTIPARKNFLRSDNTEFAHILEYIHEIALVFNTIAFGLYKDGKEIFKTANNQNSEQLLSEILGKDLAKKLIPIHADHPQVNVNGWVAEPGLGVVSRPKQFIFVNNRPIDDATIRGAIYQGYNSLLGRSEKPQFIVMIKISPHLVDFNVHPQKKEVRFIDSHLVFELVKQAVSSSLSSFSFKTNLSVQQVSSDEQIVPATTSFTQPSRPIHAFYPKSIDQKAEKEYASLPQSFTSFEFTERIKNQSQVMQVLNCFLIEELTDGIMVYDQHALHERILYEQFIESFITQKGIGKQALLVPVTIALTPVEIACLDEAKETLSQLGFNLEINESIVTIKQIPTVLSDQSVSSFIREYVADLLSNEKVIDEVKEIDDQSHRRIAYLACRSAIKAGDKLEQTEMQRLISDYHATKRAFTCPHGRPVQVKFTTAEIEKWFRRS